MRLPVLLAVDDDRDALDDVETQLVQRYAHDYRIESLGDPDDALRTLQELADGGEDVALVLASSSLSSTSGRHLLEHVRQLHPHAGRALLVPANVWSDQPTADAIRDSMALGRIDYYVPRPAGSLDEVFHEAVSSFLLEWARDRRVVPQTVHIVGETWSGPRLRAEGGLRAMRRPARLLPGGVGRRGASCSPRQAPTRSFR